MKRDSSFLAVILLTIVSAAGACFSVVLLAIDRIPIIGPPRNVPPAEMVMMVLARTYVVALAFGLGGGWLAFSRKCFTLAPWFFVLPLASFIGMIVTFGMVMLRSAGKP